MISSDYSTKKRQITIDVYDIKKKLLLTQKYRINFMIKIKTGFVVICFYFKFIVCKIYWKRQKKIDRKRKSFVSHISNRMSRNVRRNNKWKGWYCNTWNDMMRWRMEFLLKITTTTTDIQQKKRTNWIEMQIRMVKTTHINRI